MKHKRQHYIPSSYLQAWCDPACPYGQEPYVWIFSKDGDNSRKKSPERVFYEKDMYTVYTEDGQRELALEYNLSRLESEFIKLRNNRLSKRLILSSRDRLILCMFTIAMYGRTKSYGDHWNNQWKKALELGEKMQEHIENLPSEQRVIASHTPSSKEDKVTNLTIEDVRQMVERPIPLSLPGLVTKISPLLLRLPCVILETTIALGFISSDAPCVWFDPAMSQKSRLYNAGGLNSPTIEITLPLSPNQLLYFGKRLLASGVYLPINDEVVIDQLNKRTRLGSHEYFVVNQREVRSNWF